jgi:hypothetical protein
VARSRSRVLLGGLLVALAAGRPLRAQRRSSIELGASYVSFPEDRIAVVGPSLRAMTRRDSRLASLSAAVDGIASTAGVSGSMELAAERRAALGAGLLGGIGGEIGTVAGPSSSGASTGLVSARLLRTAGEGGAWMRASGQASRREAGVAWGRGVDVGAWRRWAQLLASASILREWTAGQLFAAGDRSRALAMVPVRYTEASTALSLDGESTSVTLNATLRHDPDAARRLDGGAAVSAAFRQTPTLALTVSAARQLADYVHGADAVQWVSVGVRFSARAPADVPASAARPVVLVADGAGGRELRVRAPGARTVEVMGDFTGWEPVALVPSGDLFVGPAAPAAGTHRLVVRIDGGPWRPAANTPAVADDFGGRVGLLVVP